MLEYAHGGDIKSFAKKIKCKIKKVIDLSSNINFIKPNIKYDFNSIDISSYPNYDEIYKIIAKYYKIKTNQIELFNGGSSAIFSLFQNFRYLHLKDCTIYSPAYLEYKKAANLFGYNIHHINRFKNIYKKVKQNSLVVFVNPSTPDGKYYNLKKLFQIWKKANATVLIDESFLDFTKYPSDIKFIKEYKKLYILKSMTKFYSCAGVRSGVVVSNKKNIQKLQNKQPQWKLSQYDINYIKYALKDKKFRKKSLLENKKSKKYLEKILAKSDISTKIYKSDANFILVELNNITANELQKRLEPYNIMVRDCSNFDYLDERYVRIAVKSKNDLKQLKTIFRKIDV
ncbi:MAG: aminotransferase class I/II-fold pyridoxal phosphate-dependent enzyme [Campylobacterota bacterium]|nr:aminotransferase class I/II-fold pyridoxal phosphate-dependent enzyme [Campylobacterota bacterium]